MAMRSFRVGQKRKATARATNAVLCSCHQLLSTKAAVFSSPCSSGAVLRRPTVGGVTLVEQRADGTHRICRRFYETPKSSRAAPTLSSTPGPTVKTQTEYMSMHIRAVLRNVGPVPLSKLTSYLADEFLENLGNQPGGLAGFIERGFTHFTLIRLRGGIAIAMANTVSKIFSTDQHRRQGIYVAALLSAAHYMPGQPPIVAMGLSSPHPTVEELCRGLEQWTTLKPKELEYFLRFYSEVFGIHPQTRRVRLLLIRSITPSANDKRAVVGAMPEAPFAVKQPTEGSRFASWLRTVVPSQYHVPVTYIVSKALELGLTLPMFGSFTPDVESIKSAFQRLPPGFTDIRAFGDAPNTVFVRILDPEPLLLESGVPTYNKQQKAPEVEAARYDPTQLAHELTAALDTYAQQNPLHRSRMMKGVEMARLRECVPSALMRKLEAFYGFSEQDDPRVCILLLDRLRHLWEVQLNTAAARPWSLLPDSEMPASLTLETSPSPRLLLHCQRLLIACGPQSLIEMYALIPTELKKVLCQIYGSSVPPRPSGAQNTEAEEAAAEKALVEDLEKDGEESPPPLEWETIRSALEALVRTHSLFFFMKDGQVHTPRNTLVDTPTVGVGATSVPSNRTDSNSGGHPSSPAHANADRSPAYLRKSVVRPTMGSKPVTPAECAMELHRLLPPNEMVLADALRAHFATYWRSKQLQGRSSKDQTFRREFFAHQPAYFKICPLFGFDKVVIRRAESNVDCEHLFQPVVDTMPRLLKFMALLALNSISDTSLTRRLPADTRAYLRSIGSVTDIAEQLPMWFAVQRDGLNTGSSLIRYIGPLADTPRSADALKPHRTGVLTRKVPNNPFADIAPDNIVDGEVEEWNEEWNEGDDVFGDADNMSDRDDD